ncbi:tyrosine-type recombinase/integrase [Enterococcus faecium]
MPTQLANGKYKTNLRYPKKFLELTGIQSQKYQKTFATELQAKRAEDKMRKKIARALREENANALELKGKMKFKDFYEKKWLPRYVLGQTGRTQVIPTDISIQNTKDLFRLHILPMFGEYAMNYLNSNTEIISDELTKKSGEYANIKTLKSYVRSMFDVAEIIGYIEFNKTTKVIHSITAPKKMALKEKREQEGKQALTVNELLDWLDTVKTDLEKGLLAPKDYTLFMVTLYLGDRKSETYALQWERIDFEQKTIRLKYSLDKKRRKKQTKGGKDTIIQVSDIVISLLKEWKEIQKVELNRLNIEQTPEQYVFTYHRPNGEINSPLHTDYLNQRIKTLRGRHKHLAHLTPHKLRHTFATIAKQGGADINKISEALTHSDLSTTKIYVNTPNVVNLDVYNAFDNALKQITSR